jgi:diguanylate cyclase (GGDEF)-like protein/PAS domain S-box-containing protein
LLRPLPHGDPQGHQPERTSELLRELLAAHERYPALFEQRNDGMLLFDITGSLVRANGRALAFLGVPFDAIAGRRYGKLVDPDQRGIVRAAFKRAATGMPMEIGLRVPTPASEACEIDFTLEPAFVGEELVGVYGMAQVQLLDEQTTRRIQTLASLFGNHGDAVFALDESGTCIDVNSACERLTGYSAENIYGRAFASLLAPDERLAAFGVFERALGGESVNSLTALVHRDGRRIEIAGMSVPIVVDANVIGVYVICRDVTEQTRLEAAIREQTERIRELYLVAASTGQSAEAQIGAALELGCRRLRCDGGYVTRIEEGIVTYLHVSGNAGYHVGSTHLLERSVHRFVIEAKRPVAVDDAGTGDVRAVIGTPISVSGLHFGTLCLVSSQSREAPFTAADRDFIRLIGALAASAIERGVQRRRLDALAFYDQLTQLPNRTLLADRLQQAIASAERHGTAFALHYYDLDGFKEINDTHGHMSGDDVLRTVARRFERVARQEDTVARIGGDEFVVLQPFVRARADVETLAKRLRASLSEPLVVEGITYRLTASAGVAMYPEDGREAAALLARADAALYRVKHSGRNDIHFVSPESPSS